MTSAPARTLYDKLWDDHVVAVQGDETLLYVDLHLVHEVTSPQAFAGLRAAGRRVRRPERTLAVADHNVPTLNQRLGVEAVEDAESRLQLETLASNTAGSGVEFFGMGDVRNGVVHVVGPEQGRTQPGMLIVCGDSHTSTHGAFGALAHGIGTSEVEHVLATQTLRQMRSRNMRVRFDGRTGPGVGAKDVALALIGSVGAAGGAGHVVEYTGRAVRELSMEGRMTLCNLTVELGARAGLVAPDDTTFAYLQGRPGAPHGVAWDAAVLRWRKLASDADAHFDREAVLDLDGLAPQVTWGVSPEEVTAVLGAVPDVSDVPDDRRSSFRSTLDYMGLSPGQAMQDIRINRVFVGSCTNGRIEDLREAAGVLDGRRVAPGVRAMVTPGSGLVRAQAEAEGLDVVFRAAGCDWREPGCSMCLGMNSDRLDPGERCASTSNRNFRGRQGPGGRTHLMSPAMAAAAAVAGRIVDVRAQH